jgi:hypothetical protein
VFWLSKYVKHKVVRGLVVAVRNVGSMSWFGNVPKPVSSIVFSELIDSKKKKKDVEILQTSSYDRKT